MADVCEEKVMFPGLLDPVLDSAQKNGAHFGLGPGQKDRLIGGGPFGGVDFMGLYHFVGDVPLYELADSC